ncbi:DUF4238 domain-containing protein [Herbaspirillum huttiense F1]|uniref:DUF4238 domain-containing protein n=1 Tax=Herbaspirillum huttiense TaxID=863372 RepID=UPI002885E2EA|nr:DUF4238 domain-containing protein [Herbaspirillum huttiense]MDT0359335.1 DUF4238 domain-containing protein [Herbaspirillum huttiense F1]
MADQKTRNNHYVPQWYQRGFFALGQSRLFHLNLAPDSKILPGGEKVSRTALHEWGTKNCFVEYDLYTTHFGSFVNDDIEKRLFGTIDDLGARAVRAFALGKPAEVHDSFQDFFEHMAAQKLRTPKGLDWILSCYGSMSQVDLMVEMQALRLMHCTMWAEGVREIVSAQDSDVKFILTDHPVTVYNAAADPASERCAYPQDPQVAALGSQTVFALDANTCLILTHLEYAKEPSNPDLMRFRTNARHLGDGILRTDNFIRERRLSREDVIAINYLLKSRAKRYIAAANRSWLFPEKEFNVPWAQIADVLLPKADLWRFGGDIYVGYKDGTSGYWDEYGRTSKAHELLTRESPKKNVGANDFCGCGSAYAFKDCCQRLPITKRPSWKFYGLRERNLMFCNAVRRILDLNNGASWEDVRRDLNDEKVKRIHSVFASLWPEETDLADLLPRPNPKVLRSVYMGFSDPRTIEATVLGWLPFIDEIVLVNPFFLGTRMKSEFSPIESPSSHRMQTLKNVMLLLVLEPFIRAGLVHLVPDPSEVSATFGHHVRKVLTQRTAGWTPPKGDDHQRFLKLAKEEMQRVIWMLPEEHQRRYISDHTPGASVEMIDQLIAYFRYQAKVDPYTLLQPLPLGQDGAQNQIFKGWSLEVAMYVAALTGSIIHVDTEAHWVQLLKDAQPSNVPSQPAWEPVRLALGEISFPIELDSLRVAQRIASCDRPPISSLLRRLAESVSGQKDAHNPNLLAKYIRQARGKVERVEKRIRQSTLLYARLELHVPPAGFVRHEVQRMLLMFAGVTRPRPISYALRLVLNEPESNNGGASEQGDSVVGTTGSSTDLPS